MRLKAIAAAACVFLSVSVTSAHAANFQAHAAKDLVESALGLGAASAGGAALSKAMASKAERAMPLRKAPEISASGTVGSVALLLGGVMILRGGRRRAILN